MAKTSVSRSGNLCVIDLQGLKGFVKALRKASPEMAKALRLGLREGGEIVATEARSRSSWSSRIPRSVRVRATGVNVVVLAGNQKADDAAAFENHGARGTFKHPVFATGERATWTWVSQQAKPFLRPAAEMNGPKVAERVLVAVDEALHDAGFED